MFNGVKNDKTPVIVERIVADIDAILAIVRFDGWQKTTTGKDEAVFIKENDRGCPKKHFQDNLCR